MKGHSWKQKSWFQLLLKYKYYNINKHCIFTTFVKGCSTNLTRSNTLFFLQGGRGPPGAPGSPGVDGQPVCIDPQYSLFEIRK